MHTRRLRAGEEHQYCAFQTVAIPITRIANPMQAVNYSTLIYKNYIPPGGNSYFSSGASPILLPPPSLTLTPPPSTGRGRKGKSRSKRTVPKPSSRTDNPETFGFHTPPESPEDCLDICCHRGNDVDTPRSLSDLDDDAEEEDEEMQDYRYNIADCTLFPCMIFEPTPLIVVDALTGICLEGEEYGFFHP